MLSIFSACNTRIEGCLELNAENFDLDAERSCDGCCTYPTMNLSLTQKWADENFSNADTLSDINAKPYKIQDLKYFLTSWTWRDGEGVVYSVDSVSAACNSDSIRYTPDILTGDTRQFNYPLGTIRVAPLTDSMRLVFGLVEDFSCLDNEDTSTPENLTDQSPLWNPSTTMLETVRLIVQRDLGTVTYDTIFLTTNLEFRLPYVLPFKNGFDEQFNLTVNYAQWFQDADVDDLSSFGTSIINHLPGSISPTE